jgi:flagellar protein FliL
MLRKLFPGLLALIGLGGGMGVGLVLRPSPEAEGHVEPAAEAGHAAEPAPDAAEEHATKEPTSDDASHAEEAGPADGGDEHGEGGPEYVKMNNQFVIPVVEDRRVVSMVVLTLSLEVDSGGAETVYAREPKLRDAFLQVMFDHANVGGFSGTFTDAANLIGLRTNLKEAAAMILGTVVRDVLITDIARQDS